MDYGKRRKEIMTEMEHNAQQVVVFTQKNSALQKEFRDLELREQRERREKANAK